MSYAKLPEQRRAELKELAENLRPRLKKSIKTRIELGKELIKIKEGLNHGQWGYWVKHELQMEPRTVQRYMLAVKGSEQRVKNDTCRISGDKEQTASEPTETTEVEPAITTPEPDEKYNAAHRLLTDLVECLVNGPEGLLDRINGHKVQFVIDGHTFDWQT